MRPSVVLKYHGNSRWLPWVARCSWLQILGVRMTLQDCPAMLQSPICYCPLGWTSLLPASGLSAVTGHTVHVTRHRSQEVTTVATMATAAGYVASDFSLPVWIRNLSGDTRPCWTDLGGPNSGCLTTALNYTEVQDPRPKLRVFDHCSELHRGPGPQAQTLGV